MSKKEGDRKICQVCNVEIVCKLMRDDRLSWRNADSSAHFYKDEITGEFIHTPTILTPEEVWKAEIEERLARLERINGVSVVD